MSNKTLIKDLKVAAQLAAVAGSPNASDLYKLAAAALGAQEWQPIEDAPKNKDILVWFDHDLDPHYDPADPEKLTDYAANAEGGEYMSGKGFAVARWNDQEFEIENEYGEGYWLPSGWFVRNEYGEYIIVCNAIHWKPLTPPEAE